MYGPPLAYSAEELRRLKFYTLPKSRRLRETVAALARELEGFVYSDEELKTKQAFREADHPRGQPDNAGQFVEKDKQTAAPDTEAKHKGTPAGQEQADTPEKEGIPETPYKNHAEFAGAMASKFKTRNNDFFVSTNLQDLNITTMSISSEGIENMVKKFPAVKDTLKGFDFTTGEVLMDCGPKGVIGFNKEYFKSYKEVKDRSINPDTVSGNLESTEDRLNAAGIHEAAHLMELTLIQRKYKDKRNIERVWKDSSEVKRIIDNAFEKLGTKKDTEKDIIAAVSDLANKNASELFAETITYYHYGDKIYNHKVQTEKNMNKKKQLERNHRQAVLFASMLYNIVEKELGGKQ
jgi:hypothetical protein